MTEKTQCKANPNIAKIFTILFIVFNALTKVIGLLTKMVQQTNAKKFNILIF